MWPIILRSTGSLRLTWARTIQRPWATSDQLLARPPATAPTLICEIHSAYVVRSQDLRDTPLCRLMIDHGYDVFALRDIWRCEPFDSDHVELVDLDSTYLEGPPLYQRSRGQDPRQAVRGYFPSGPWGRPQAAQAPRPQVALAIEHGRSAVAAACGSEDQQVSGLQAGIRLQRDWCGQEDSNFHGLSPTTTSTLRVYQFRHDRTVQQFRGF